MKPLKVIHVPYSKRNPYQTVLGDTLRALGIRTEGAQTHNLFHISFLNITFFDILVRYWRPDIIHLHWQHAFLLESRNSLKMIIKASISLFQVIFLKIIGVKFVWTVHNLVSHENTFRALEKSFTKILARLSDVIITHCQAAKKEISEKLNMDIDNKIFVVPHGSYINYYPNTVSQKIARNQLRLSESKLFYLFLGEVRYYKGVLELIDAFQAMESEDVLLLIVGKPYNKKIIEEIQIRINGNRRIRTILRFIPDDEIQTYINASDILVYPYRNIFTSGGIFLALSFGKPIIAPFIGCIADTLDRDGSFLYDPEEQDGLSKAIKKARASNRELQRMGKHNLYLAKKLDWKIIARLTLSAYQQALMKNISDSVIHG